MTIFYKKFHGTQLNQKASTHLSRFYHHITYLAEEQKSQPMAQSYCSPAVLHPTAAIIRITAFKQCNNIPPWLPLWAITHTRSHTHNHFTALWILSGATQVRRYQKKHSPTHTYRGHQSSLSASSIYYDPWHPLCSIYVPDSLLDFYHNISPSFWSTSWPSTLHFILHTFLHPIIVFFSPHVPIPLQPVLLYY